jgi:Spy/CpxP family protein refolding chaperone
MNIIVRLMRPVVVVAIATITAPSLAEREPDEAEGIANEGTEPPRVESEETGLQGMRRVFERSFAEIELRPEQKEAIAKLIVEGRQRHQPTMRAKRQLMLAMADQLDEGKFDRCGLEAEVDALVSAMSIAHPEDRRAFEMLHAILTPEQRERFATALERNFREFETRVHDPERALTRMNKELQLTDDQRARLAKILPALRDIREAEPSYTSRMERWAKVLKAFKNERLVLDEIVRPDDFAERSKAFIEGHLWAGEAIVPILTKEQHGLMAKKIREKAEQLTQTAASAWTLEPTEQ